MPRRATCCAAQVGPTPRPLPRPLSCQARPPCSRGRRQAAPSTPATPGPRFPGPQSPGSTCWEGVFPRGGLRAFPATSRARLSTFKPALRSPRPGTPRPAPALRRPPRPRPRPRPPHAGCRLRGTPDSRPSAAWPTPCTISVDRTSGGAATPNPAPSRSTWGWRV